MFLAHHFEWLVGPTTFKVAPPSQLPPPPFPKSFEFSYSPDKYMNLMPLHHWINMEKFWGFWKGGLKSSLWMLLHWSFQLYSSCKTSSSSLITFVLQVRGDWMEHFVNTHWQKNLNIWKRHMKVEFETLRWNQSASRQCASVQTFLLQSSVWPFLTGSRGTSCIWLLKTMRTSSAGLRELLQTS